eukprot:6538975-Prymnesium_polylepis.2
MDVRGAPHITGAYRPPTIQPGTRAEHWGVTKPEDCAFCFYQVQTALQPAHALTVSWRFFLAHRPLISPSCAHRTLGRATPSRSLGGPRGTPS